MKKIGEILRYAREDLDLTQIDVMKQTGIHNKTLSGYENEVSEPDLETFAKLLTLYRLSADDVLEIPSGNGRNGWPVSEEEKAFLREYKKLSKQQRDDLYTAVKALAQKNSRSRAEK